MKKFFKVSLIVIAVLFGWWLLSGLLFLVPSLIAELRYRSQERNATIVSPDGTVAIVPDNRGWVERIISPPTPQPSPTPDDSKEKGAHIEINYPSVSEKVKEAKIDCRNSKEIPAEHRKGKMVCENIYRTSAEGLKTGIAEKTADRSILYGQYVIFNCPTTSKAQIDDLSGQCYEMARFLDNYAYGESFKKLRLSPPQGHLYVHLADGKDEIEGYCGKGTIGCSKAKTIYVYIHDKAKHLISSGGVDRTYKSGYRTGPNDEITYLYYEDAPPNCGFPAIYAHEFMHYADYQAYGDMNSWMEEGVARIYESQLYEEICPPGFKAVDPSREEGGKTTKLPSLDLTNQEAMTSFLKKFWEGDRCKLAYFLVINKEVKKQGLAFHKDMAAAFDKGEWKAIIRELIKVSSDPEEVEKIFKDGGCRF